MTREEKEELAENAAQNLMEAQFEQYICFVGHILKALAEDDITPERVSRIHLETLSKLASTLAQYPEFDDFTDELLIDMLNFEPKEL